MASQKRKGITRGMKVNNTHSTYIPEAGQLILSARKLPQVTKVVLGKIVRVKGGNNRRLKFTLIQAGIKLVVRGATAQQDLFVYTAEADKVQQKLNQVWNEEIVR